MKVTFVVMGCESLGIQSLSAVLKKNNHKVTLAFDPALFDDQLYFNIPFLAKLVDYKKEVIKKVVNSKPDLVGFNVFADNFKWACRMAREIKKHISVPIIFGGIFPTACPETVIKEDCVDMICLREGEQPLLELVNSMEKGKIDYSIKNMWFKKGKKIIKNKLRDLQDLNKLPFYDKKLFEDELLIKNCYMTVTQEGCPFNCTYCSQNFLREYDKDHGQYLRRKSIDNIIKELKIMKKRYKFKEVDFKDNTFTANKQWTLDFLKRYKKEIGVPFRIMTHPTCIDEDLAKALKEAKVHRVQLGIQSMNPKTRREILGRFETNEQIIKCFEALDKYKINYSIDHIFGLPNENEEQQIEAARVYAKLKSCSRITIFWLEYFPKTKMVDIAKKAGMITEKDIESIESGGEQNYQTAQGSIRDEKLKDIFMNYHLFFRTIPILPEKVVNFILDHKLQRYYKYLPRSIILLFIDFFMSFAKNDYSAIQYLKYYFFQMRKVAKAKLISS